MKQSAPIVLEIHTAKDAEIVRRALANYQKAYRGMTDCTASRLLKRLEATMGGPGPYWHEDADAPPEQPEQPAPERVAGYVTTGRGV